MVAKSAPASYGLDPLFERIVAEVAASRPAFWARAGHEVDPDRIVDPSSRLVLESVRAIATDSKPPTSPVIVLQRLRAWFEQGRVDMDQLDAARDLLEAAAEDGSSFDLDSICGELVPALRKQLQRSALEAGYIDYAKRGSLEQMEKLLLRAKRLGVQEFATGTRLTAAALPGLVERSRREYLATGIEELDGELKGGPRRATFTLITGAPKSGKSMFLDHVIAESISRALSCALATLELSEDDHLARIVGNLVDLPYDDITRFPDVAALAQERMRALEEEGVIAFCTIKHFPSGLTTIEDIDQWLTLEEEKFRIRFSVLGIDYGQLLGGTTKKARHEELSEISEKARLLAQQRDLWLLMPSQATTDGMNGRKTRVIENHHTADSRGLPKACDLHITINTRDDGQTILWHVAGNRHGPSGGDVGPLPHDFERGRVAYVHRRGWLY